MKFTNPTNNYSVYVEIAPLWCFLFGPLYFLASGIWRHFLLLGIISGIILGAGNMVISKRAQQEISAVVYQNQDFTAEKAEKVTQYNNKVILWTLGILFATTGIYACYVNEIVRHHYLQKGWVEEKEASPEEKQDSPNQAQE